MSNDVREELGRQASIEGFAHQHIALGILMKKYGNVSLVDLPLSTYDIVIVRKIEGREDFIRCQVKTAKKDISFTGGTRGGKDRIYKSDVKKYIQSTKTSDVVIGVHPNSSGSFDLYFVPTILIEKLNQQSISLNRIRPLKNNYQMLEKCKDHEYVIEECIKLGILTK